LFNEEENNNGHNSDENSDVLVFSEEESVGTSFNHLTNFKEVLLLVLVLGFLVIMLLVV